MCERFFTKNSHPFPCTANGDGGGGGDDTSLGVALLLLSGSFAISILLILLLLYFITLWYERLNSSHDITKDNTVAFLSLTAILYVLATRLTNMLRRPDLVEQTAMTTLYRGMKTSMKSSDVSAFIYCMCVKQE